MRGEVPYVQFLKIAIRGRKKEGAMRVRKSAAALGWRKARLG